MALLTDDFAADITPEVLALLAWRTVWLHAALTSPRAALLAPRDRELLSLVATSALGVDVDLALRHLRRAGSSSHAGGSCIARLLALDYVSLTDDRIDLPLQDLRWIETTVSKGR